MFVKIPDEACTIELRLLPGEPKFVPSCIHLVNGLTFHCHKNLVDDIWQGSCVCCEKREWLLANGPNRKMPEAELQKALRELAPVQRFYWNVIVQKSTHDSVCPLPLPMVRVWSAGKLTQRMFMAGLTPEMNVLDLENGWNFQFVKRILSNGMPDYSRSKFTNKGPAATVYPSQSLFDERQAAIFMDGRFDLLDCRSLVPAEEMLTAMEDYFGPLDRQRRGRFRGRAIDTSFRPAW